MLKFRMTNSVKARRSAEAQRSALEEKLEWAWKPLAAMMNEKATDMVYWMPPLYNSNVIAAPSNSVTITMRQGSVRKRKLSSSRRRSKLMNNNSITYCQNDIENNSSIIDDSKPDDDEWENEDDNESGINEDTAEYPQGNESVVTSQAMESGGESDKEMSDIDKEILMHNAQLHKTPVVVQSNTNKPKKLTSSPTLLKLMDKFSYLHGLPGIIQVKNKENTVRKVSVRRNNKRPSVRVYKAPSNSVTTAMRQGSVRKKKLSSSRRRSKLMTNDSITEEMQEEVTCTVKEDDPSNYCQDMKNNSSIVDDSMLDDDEWENQDDNESGIHEETVDCSQGNESIMTSQAMESGGDSDKEMSDIDKEILMHNAQLHKTPILVKGNPNKAKKLTSSPTLLKLMEKFSHLHGIPGIMQVKNKENSVRKVTYETRKNFNNKNKRPSVRVYQKHTQRSSIRSNSSVRSNNKTSNQKEIIITATPLLSRNPSIKRVHNKQPQCDDRESGIFDQSDTDNEDQALLEENLHNAQLQMMLRILAQLYEEKLTRQETELGHLRMRVQTQEKLLKKLVHVTMDVKSDVDTLKKNQKLSNEFKALNEMLKTIEDVHTKVNIVQKPPISSKSNVLTIKL